MQSGTSAPLLYDETNSVDQAEKILLALCQGRDEAEVYCQKFRKWSVLTQWNECALAAIFRKGLSEALKDVMLGFPTPAGLSESMSLAIQIDRRLRERKAVHHLAVFSEHRPEPMQCDRAERQEHRHRNGLCFYCGDSTHAISDCPKRTKRFARSATISTVQSKFLLCVTLICSLSSYSVMAFVDSGAALNLMDLEFARRCGFFLEPLQYPIPLRGIDATPLAKNKPQYWTQLTMCMAPAHQEDIRFLMLHNLHDVVVLGLPWLQVHNPVLDWKSMSVSGWGCQGVHGDVPLLSVSPSTPSEVPEFLSDYRDVFEEPKSGALPPHRDCDCAINLIPGINPNYTCGGVLNETSGIFNSPFFPGLYPNNAHCEWVMRVKAEHTVDLSFLSLNLDSSFYCSSGSVSVYDGTPSNSPLLGRLCGTSKRNFTSSLNGLSVVYNSRGANINFVRGFQASYYAVSQISQNVTLTCTSSYMEAQINIGYLQSLGYSPNDIFLNDPRCHPQNYGNWIVFSIPYDGCGTIRQVR
ncbi:unnamed protein product [Ranitomeya imitator]|uniref:CUB domain-containing protein n=1 Tax=Ranitomeya imitator TaxID=111125 RepID=A0ABN9LAG7_9NEOB|nr:unnamed protein product [Ranitomeya imitator]